MTTFLVIVPLLMLILSIISMLLTIKYQNDSRQIDSLRSQRSSIKDYAEKLITAYRIYIESLTQYSTERYLLELALRDKKDITSSRSDYVYKLKDTVRKNRITLQVTAEIMRIEIANSEFPNVKSQLDNMFQSFETLASNWESNNPIDYTPDNIKVFQETANHQITELVILFGRTQDQLTQDIHNTNLYMDIMKRFKHVTIDPLFDRISNK